MMWDEPMVGARFGEAGMFGRMVREYRRRLGWTQEDLAGRTGLSVASIGKIEAGRVSAVRQSTLRLLAEAFELGGVDRDQFYAAAAGEPVDPPAGPVAAPVLPAQLPASVSSFAGRSRQLRELDLLLTAHDGDRPATVVICAVSGTAGIGKTALAVHWAHRVADRFPDGQLYVNLRGFDPDREPITPQQAIGGFLDALQVSPAPIPPEVDAQAALYRSLLAHRRMLILLDNARDSAQVRPLLPGSPTCLVVVTSRNQLASLVAAHCAHPISLDLLTPGEARDLLTRRLGADRVHAEPDPVDEIITRCAGLPLALTIVAARAAAHPSFPLHSIAAALRSAGHRLEAVTGEDPTTDLRAVFSWSYHTISHDAARMFRLLGLHPGPDITAPAAASLTATSLPHAHTLLAELARASLITEHHPGRYTLHDLLRAYATDLAHTTDTDTDRHAATRRILDHYLHTAHRADQRLHRARQAIELPPPPPGIIVEQFTDREHALTWYAAECAGLTAAIHHAAATGFDAHTWQLAWTTTRFRERGGHWPTWIKIPQLALDAARRLGDRTGMAHAHYDLARAHGLPGRYDVATTHLQHALDLFTQIGDQAGQAYTLDGFLWISLEQGKHREALIYAEQSRDLRRKTGDRLGEARSLSNIASALVLLGDHDSAIHYGRQALELVRELGASEIEHLMWSTLGLSYHEGGRYDDAITCYQRAIELCKNSSEKFAQARITNKLAATYHATGQTAAARQTWQHSLNLLNDLDHPSADAIRAKLRELNHQEH